MENIYRISTNGYLAAALFLLCILFIFPVPAYAQSTSISSIKKYDYVKLSGIATKEALKKIKAKTNLIPSGLGVGMIDCVYNNILLFDACQIQEKSELRLLIVQAMETYLHTVNTSKNLRPFLSDFPYQPENVSIYIFVSDSTGREVYEPNLGLVCCLGGIVSFKIRPEGAWVSEAVATEPYETAREIAYAKRFGYVCDDTPSDDHP